MKKILLIILTISFCGLTACKTGTKKGGDMDKETLVKIEILCFEFGVKGIFLIEIPSFLRHGSLAIKANGRKRGVRTSCRNRFLTR